MIRHFKSILGSTALAGILASAAMTAMPAVASADWHRDDDRRDVQRYDDHDRDHGHFDRDDHRDDHRDFRHDDHGGIVIVDRPVVVAPPVVTNRVWVEPVYRTVNEQVFVAPTYRTVTDHVWHPPVVQQTCERVWVPDEYKTIPNPFAAGSFQRVLVKKAHYEDVKHDVVVKAGYSEDVCRQELVCDGHYETVSHQELVSAGHWDDTCVAVETAPRHDNGFRFSIHF